MRAPFSRLGTCSRFGDAEIDSIVERTRATLDETLEDPDVRGAMA